MTVYLFWQNGFKLQLICNERGEVSNFMLTRANVGDRGEHVFNRLCDNVFDKLFADRIYITGAFRQALQRRHQHRDRYQKQHE